MGALLLISWTSFEGFCLWVSNSTNSRRRISDSRTCGSTLGAHADMVGLVGNCWSLIGRGLWSRIRLILNISSIQMLEWNPYESLCLLHKIKICLFRDEFYPPKVKTWSILHLGLAPTFEKCSLIKEKWKKEL